MEVVESDSEVAEADGDGVTIRNHLNRVDYTTALDLLLQFHLDGIVDPDQFHVRLEQDDLVDALKVVDLVDDTVMRYAILNFSRLCVHHVNLGGIFSVVLNLMLNQVRRQVCKLDGLRIRLVGSEEEVEELLNEVISP